MRSPSCQRLATLPSRAPSLLAQIRYQGVDWRDRANWGCNGQRNPYGEHYLDGASLEATEVMFVKVKQRLLERRWSYPTAAVRYDAWLAASDAVRPAWKLPWCRRQRPRKA